MAGISSKAARKLENKKRYNSIDWENDLDIAIYDAYYRELDPQMVRWWQIDPRIDDMEAWSPYVSMFNNPILKGDPLGDWPDGSGILDGLKDLAKTAVGNVGGVVVGVVDNVLGSNIRSSVATTIQDPTIAQGWNNGLNAADVASVTAGRIESGIGTGVAVGSVGVTAGSGGLSIAVSGPTLLGGVALTTHGLLVSKNAGTNLVSQNGRVNIQGSGEGRGKNNRKPDPAATGDHTVSNNSGSTTYQRNDRNPNGFQEVKRVDTQGKPHGRVPTPHVIENNKVRPATPDEIPKTDLSRNNPK